ncbi:MAG: glycosyltransferase family 2 protein [Xanthobacteraceae bacterium]|nr:glycosyltransferase family 2 protein [Xanthobacteraceae bacterium]
MANSLPERNRVAILLATYNAGRFLTEQLNSIERQTHRNWEVWASDDGSADDTLPLLEKYRSRWGDDRLRILRGPREGFVANYFSLLSNDAIRSDYYAFSDQDDVWLPDKLTRSIAALSRLEAASPAIHGGRTRLIDCRGHVLGQSPLFRRPPSFRNALVQNIAGGNTMTFNAAARELLAPYCYLRPVSHDWWSYMVVTGAGGTLIYDPEPSVLYRQHHANLTGENRSLVARTKRLFMILDNRFRRWTDINIACLSTLKERLTLQNQAVLDRFCELRMAPMSRRMTSLTSRPVYRQTALGDLGMAVALICRKL